MSRYLCHACAARHGFLRPPPPDLISNEYQLEKYIKHTVLDPKFPVVSVFESTSTGVYRDFVVSTLAAGSVEVDDHGRRNVVWAAHRPVGVLFSTASAPRICEAVRLVLSSSTGLIHAFPDESARLAEASCSDCGGQVIL